MGRTGRSNKREKDDVATSTSSLTSALLAVAIVAIVVAGGMLGSDKSTSVHVSTSVVENKLVTSPLIRSWATAWSTPMTTRPITVLSENPRVELDASFLSDFQVQGLLAMHEDESSGYMNDDDRGFATRLSKILTSEGFRVEKDTFVACT